MLSRGDSAKDSTHIMVLISTSEMNNRLWYLWYISKVCRVAWSLSACRCLGACAYLCVLFVCLWLVQLVFVCVCVF